MDVFFKLRILPAEEEGGMSVSTGIEFILSIIPGTETQA